MISSTVPGHGGTRVFWYSRWNKTKFRNPRGLGHAWLSHFLLDAGKRRRRA
jgi:hypothetical protein